MWRLVAFIIAAALLGFGLSWLADRPGTLTVNWQGYELATGVFEAVVLLTLLVGSLILGWSLLRQLWRSPATVGHLLTRRRQKKGLEALSSGMIAVGAGDKAMATRYAVQARKTLPNEPLTHLLRAQAAHLSGDRATSRRIYDAMLGSPDTEQLGLRGLFLEAQREGELEAARQYAERAVELNPKLGWPVESLFDIHCRTSDWSGALATIDIARKHSLLERKTADRRRAVLLTAQALDKEESDPNKAIELAREAAELAHDLVPAAALAGRLMASRGQTPKAARLIERTWKRAPHPDLALVYAYVRPGDAPRDRLKRMKELARLTPNSMEGPIAVALAAIEARQWDEARKALQPLHGDRLTQRVCTVMARIEGGQHGDKGRVREWLARAVNAPRDPAWTADGVVAERWAPISPVTGQLDAFRWRVPVESLDMPEGDALTGKVEELVALGARIPGALPSEADVIDRAAEIAEAKTVTVKPAAAPSAAEPSRAPAAAEASDGPVTDVHVLPPSRSAIAQPQPQPATTQPAPVKARVLDPKTGKFVSSSAVGTSARPAASVEPARADHKEPDDRNGNGRADAAGHGDQRRPDAIVAPVRSGTGRPPQTARAAPRRDAEIAGGAAGESRDAREKRGEARFFVPGHAPDDPGPETHGEVDEARTPMQRMRGANG